MKKSSFPHWIYDGSPIADPLGYGQEAVDFLRALKHPASTAPKNAFQLYKPFERMTRAIYGPRNPDGSRIVRTVFMMVGRGNRKTSYAAAWSLLHIIGPEARRGGQAIFAANDREQASIGFREAANIINMDKRLIAATKIYGRPEAPNTPKQITSRDNHSTLKVVSSDGRAQHGTTPSFVLVDEIHAWKGRDLWEALDSGLAKTSDTLMIICTTAGRGQAGIGFEKYEYALKVASGEVADPTFLPVLFQAETGDDWQDEATWHKANPGLVYGFPPLEELRIKATRAAHSPSDRYQFEQLHLNRWQAASRDPLFDMNVFDAGYDKHFDLADLEKLPCYLGVDVSRSGDLTAIVAAWRHDNGTISAYPWFFLPSEGLDEKARLERMPYPRWQAEGYLDLIEGSTVEPDAVADKIIELCARFDVREVTFDPSLAGLIMAKVMDHGINVNTLRQRPSEMHGPICDLERTVNGKRLRHSGHPILRTHLEGAVVKRSTNASGLVTMHKGSRHTNHIDGAVASAIAVSRALADDGARSIYDRPDFDELFAA